MRKAGPLFLLLSIASVAFASEPSTYESALATGNRLLEEDKYAEAADVFEDAVKSLRADQDGESLDSLHLLFLKARAYTERGKERKGFRYFDEAIELLRQPWPENSEELVAEAFSIRDSTRTGWDQPRRFKQLKEIYDVARDTFGEADIRTGRLARQMAWNAIDSGWKNDANAHLDEAHSILSSVEFVDPDPIGVELLFLAAGYMRVGRIELGNDFLIEAMAIGTTSDGPTLVARTAPIYPAVCLTKRIQGEVAMGLRIDSRGRVLDVEVLDTDTWRGSKKRESSDEPCRKSLGRAASNAARKFRFIPNLVDGSPDISESYETTVTFAIE